MNIVESIADRNLIGAFAPFFHLGSWEKWLIFLRGLEGLPLSEEEEQVFENHTGCEYCPPEGGWREATVVRGLRAIFAVSDELALFGSTENFSTDREMLTALRPTLAMTGGRLVILSSPYGQSGALWDLHRRHHGRDDSSVLVWKASASEMNSLLSADYLERMRESDPEAYASEVEGVCREGLSTLFDFEAIQACVANDRLELPPVPGEEYKVGVDRSGGRSDGTTVCITHRVADRCEVDLLRAWSAPHNPAAATEEICGLARECGIYTVVGDRYAGEWPREACRSHGIRYEVADKAKSDLYLALLSYVNSGRIVLPDHRELLRELRGLERGRGSSGRDRVDHVAGSHDDLANAVALAA